MSYMLMSLEEEDKERDCTDGQESLPLWARFHMFWHELKVLYTIDTAESISQ